MWQARNRKLVRDYTILSEEMQKQLKTYVTIDVQI